MIVILFIHFNLFTAIEVRRCGSFTSWSCH